MPAGTDTQATQDSASVDSTSDSATPTDTFEDAGDSPALVDVGEPTDAGDDEDVSAVVFDDGLTIPAPGEAACDNKDDIVIIANGKVALDDSADGIRERTGCDDLEDAFVKAIEMVEPA